MYNLPFLLVYIFFLGVEGKVVGALGSLKKNLIYFIVYFVEGI